jgi:hypothetical protein
MAGRYVTEVCRARDETTTTDELVAFAEGGCAATSAPVNGRVCVCSDGRHRYSCVRDATRSRLNICMHRGTHPRAHSSPYGHCDACNHCVCVNFDGQRIRARTPPIRLRLVPRCDGDWWSRFVFSQWLLAEPATAAFRRVGFQQSRRPVSPRPPSRRASSDRGEYAPALESAAAVAAAPTRPRASRYVHLQANTHACMHARPVHSPVTRRAADGNAWHCACVSGEACTRRSTNTPAAVLCECARDPVRFGACVRAWWAHAYVCGHPIVS